MGLGSSPPSALGEDVACGVCVGVTSGVAVADGVAVGLAVEVGLSSGVAVGVADGVGVAVGARISSTFARPSPAILIISSRSSAASGDTLSFTSLRTCS